LTITVEPGAVVDIGFFGLSNVDEVFVQMWDVAGGELTFDEGYSTEDYLGADPYWAFFFNEPRHRNQLTVGGMPASTECRIVVTLSSFDGNPVSVGMIAFGVFESLGLSEYGFTVSPVDYSRITTDDYGTSRVKKGRSAKDLRGSVFMPAVDANAAANIVYSLLGVPAVWRASKEITYDYLTSFGLGSADITPEGPFEAQLSLTVKGLI